MIDVSEHKPRRIPSAFSPSVDVLTTSHNADGVRALVHRERRTQTGHGFRRQAFAVAVLTRLDLFLYSHAI